MRFGVALMFVVALFNSGYGQNITLSSKAVDKETKEPLPFASVGIKGKPIGTITNLQGDFDFHFPENYRNEILVITMLGYQNFEAPVWSVLDARQTEILLEKSTTVLSTLVVSDSLTGGDVLRIALSRIDQNYPSQPFLLDGFYRDLKKIGDTYVSLLEAAIKIYDEDYRAPRNKFKLRERVALREVRRSLGYENKFTSYFDEDNLLEDLLLHNNIRYRQFPEEEVFYSVLKRDKDSYYDNQEVFVVTHHQDYDLTVYVSKKNFGILRVEYENNEIHSMNHKRGLNSKFVGLKKVIDYKTYNEKIYLNYISLTSKINWYDDKTDKLKFETQLEQQLLVNQVYPEPEERVGVTEKMRSYGLQYQDLRYNKTFWESYNMIKESPLDKKIIADLERSGALEKQFEKN